MEPIFSNSHLDPFYFLSLNQELFSNQYKTIFFRVKKWVYIIDQKFPLFPFLTPSFRLHYVILFLFPLGHPQLICEVQVCTRFRNPLSLLPPQSRWLCGITNSLKILRRRVNPLLNPVNKANLSSRENSHTVVAS